LAEYDDVIRGPLFSLASGPPNPKPTTDYNAHVFLKTQDLTATTLREKFSTTRPPVEAEE